MNDSNGRTQVARIKAEDSLDKHINRALELLGGIDKFIQPGDEVTLKPNLNSADPFPAASDPQFIHALMTTILKAEPSKLRIVESSMFALNTREVAEKNGILSVAEENGAELAFLDEGEWIKQNLDKGVYMKNANVGEALMQYDKLVLAPCLKTHPFARFTGAMKLLVGTIKGADRLKMHARRLEQKIADLASYFRPTLIVMDARKVFVTGGPTSGDLESPNYILAGTDMVAIDVEGVRILQSYEANNRLDLPVWEVPQIKHAVRIGLGAQSDDDISVIEA